jgi:hypothetical protein
MIKKFVFFIAIQFIFSPLLAQKHYLFTYFTGNGEDGLHLAYSTDGLKWESLGNGKSFLKPEVGPDKLMRDPCVILGPDGRYHLVWTSGWHDQIIGYANTSDFLNWSSQQTIPVMTHEPTAKNSWAPEVFYDKKHKQYLIFWATTIPGRHSDVADSEKEKGLNHRMYYTITKDFKTFSPTKMFFNPDFSVIDATLIEHKKRFWMILKNENPNPPEKNLRLSTSKKAQGSYKTKVSEKITGDYWAEGPTTLKIGEYIYIYFDKYRDHKYGCVRSKDMKNWEDISDQVVFPNGIRHGTALEVTKNIINDLK